MVHEAHLQRRAPSRRRVRTAGYLLGAALAGLLDGILFQGLLAWRAPAQLLQAAAWLLAVAAVAMLWRARARFAEPGAGRVLVGSALVGAGLLQALGPLAARLPAPWLAGDLAAAAFLLLAGWRMVATAARARENVRRRARRGRPT